MLIYICIYIFGLECNTFESVLILAFRSRIENKIYIELVVVVGIMMK